MKKEEPIITIVMCVHDTCESFFLESVKSIINQSFTGFELIIVDDASNKNLFTDGIFNDYRIRIIKEKINHGPAYCRNVALRIAKGKYIAIMDSDDVAMPQRLEKQFKFLESNIDCVACGTWFRFIGQKKHEVQRVIDDSDYYRCSLLFGNNPTILNPSVMIRKDALLTHNICYDEQLLYGEDYKMWVQLSEVGKITNIKEVLMCYRIHNSQLTNGNKNKNKSFKYDAVVREYILNKLGLCLEKHELKSFLAKKGLKHVDPIAYRFMLDKIVACNNISHYYKNEALNKRINDQWKQVIYSTNNLFKWIGIIIKLKKYRKQAIRIKISQLKNKIKGN